jgi:hypothetical protein
MQHVAAKKFEAHQLHTAGNEKSALKEDTFKHQHQGFIRITQKIWFSFIELYFFR